MSDQPRDGRSGHWPQVRAAHLQREPVCQACGIDRDLEVHHIVPFHVDRKLELVDANLITLCEHPGHDCHFHHGHHSDWRRWVPDVRATVARYAAEQVKGPT